MTWIWLWASAGPALADVAPKPLPRTLFISPMGEPFRASVNEAYPSRQWFDRADADHDGKLTRAEFIADAERFFDEIEVDEAGFLTNEDIARYENELAPEISGRIPPGSAYEDGGGSQGVRTGHHGSSIDPTDQDRGGAAGAIRNHSAEPQGQINATTRRDERPEGAAIYSVLPFPEPVTSAKTYYGQHITREIFSAAASKRFDMLTGSATVLKFEDLPRTWAQRAGAKVR